MYISNRSFKTFWTKNFFYENPIIIGYIPDLSNESCLTKQYELKIDIQKSIQEEIKRTRYNLIKETQTKNEINPSKSLDDNNQDISTSIKKEKNCEETKMPLNQPQKKELDLISTNDKENDLGKEEISPKEESLKISEEKKPKRKDELINFQINHNDDFSFLGKKTKHNNLETDYKSDNNNNNKNNNNNTSQIIKNFLLDLLKKYD